MGSKINLRRLPSVLGVGGVGVGGNFRSEKRGCVLQVHWTLPLPEVQHGPDLRAGDWSATPRPSWSSLATCPTLTSATHSAPKVSHGPCRQPASWAWSRKAQLQYDPRVHRFVCRYDQTPSAQKPVSPSTNKAFPPPVHPGFVPQAQFIFAKNCSQVWAEALNSSAQWKGSPELPQQVAKGETETEKDQEPALEPGAERPPEPEQAAEQVWCLMLGWAPHPGLVLEFHWGMQKGQSEA